MRFKTVILLFSALVVFSGCEQSLDNDTLGEEFVLLNFLQDGDSNVPLDADLQVYMGDLVSDDEFENLEASLVDQDGNTVVGDQPIPIPGSMILVYIPSSLKPGTTYTLIVRGPGGKVFTYTFTTVAGTGGSPPQVTFNSITTGDPSSGEAVIPDPADGVAVTGVVRVEVEATDETGLQGNLTSALEGVETGYRTLFDPFVFYVNTLAAANGLRTIEVRATDDEGNLGTGSLQVNVQNGLTPGAVPFWIFVENKGGESYGLDLTQGITPSAILDATLLITGGNMLLELYAFTDSYYLFNDPYLVGSYDYDGSNYSYHPRKVLDVPSFSNPGVPCVMIFNALIMAITIPAYTFDLVMPDHSTLTVYLPVLSFPDPTFPPSPMCYPQVAAFYIAADGSTHYAYVDHQPHCFDNSNPDLSPSAAIDKDQTHWAAGP